MKKIIYFAFMSLALVLSSCGEDFLEVKDYYSKNNESYYSRPQDIKEALAGAYSALSFDNAANNATLLSEVLSDDRLAGGGSDDQVAKDLDGFKKSSIENRFQDLWVSAYQGVLRTNNIIKYFDQAEYDSEDEKNQDLGEAHFLRAFFYYRLAKFFGTVPVVTDPDKDPNQPKASAEVLYGLIASDLKKAIEIMPATSFPDIGVERLGHANKWAAEAMMARVFLFYTGYYQQSDLPLTDGGSISKNQVITWLDDCISQSGHTLTSDFRNNWPYSYAGDDYGYASTNSLSWVGESGANMETVFAVKYGAHGNWYNEQTGQRISFINQAVLFQGIRGNQILPFGTGWGWATVNPQLYDSFESGDIRREGSIINVLDPNEGIADEYEFCGDHGDHDTGLWGKKYSPIEVKVGDDSKGMFYTLYGGEDSYMLWHMQDEVVIRFADILLMGAELGSTNAQSYFDRVRSRAGLASKPATLENIKLERRHELAGEGLRYHDLLRWHDAESAFAQVKDIPVKSNGADVLYSVTYRPETGGFLPIPETQVRLSGGVLTQNPGWE